MRRAPAHPSVHSSVCALLLLLAGNQTAVSHRPAEQSASPGRLTVSEQPLWEVDKGINWKSLRVSPDNKRIAYAAKRNDKWVVVVDGVAGREYDQITIGKGWHDSEFLGFSPDSRHLAHTARRGNAWFMVVDGVEGEPYEAIIEIDTWRGNRGYAVFSADGGELAHSARVDNEWVVVVNGQITAPYRRGDPPYFTREPAPRVFGSEVTSPDGTRVARIVYEGLEAYVEVDGVPGRRYRTSTALREAANALAGMALGSIYDAGGPHRLIFSPDSQRLAYLVVWRGREWLVVDGVEYPHYDTGIIGPRFSPDGRHVAFVAHRGREYVIVVDGAESSPYPVLRQLSQTGHFASFDITFDELNRCHTFAVRDDHFLRVIVAIGDKL